MITHNDGYHNSTYCPKCEHPHTVKMTDNIDGYMCEATTVCESCGHVDHWAYGYYWNCIEEYEC